MDITKFLGGITVEEFLKDYWCKKPLLVKNAVADTKGYISLENMRELAVEESVESMLILPKEGDENWVCKHGPLNDEDFKKQEELGGTLVCHGLDLYAPLMAELEKMARFVPNWQFDDVMVSHSYPGEGVGAHIDSYNVFIIQGHGTKRWQLELNPSHDHHENLAIKIMKDFNPEIDWTLEPGDMVYLPPHVAHHGTAVTEGMSYSIGFRAYKHEDMFSAYFQHHLETSDDMLECYNDAKLEKSKRPFFITNEDIEKVKTVFEKNLFNKETMSSWMGCYVTEPRQTPDKNEDLAFEEFTEEFKAGRPLFQDYHTRFAAMEGKAFVNGKEFEVENEMTPLLEKGFAALKMEEMPFDRDKMSIKSIMILHKAYELGAIFFTE